MNKIVKFMSIVIINDQFSMNVSESVRLELKIKLLDLARLYPIEVVDVVHLSEEDVFVADLAKELSTNDYNEELSDALNSVNYAIELVEEYSTLWHYQAGLNIAKKILQSMMEGKDNG